jgi:hypothetical protein
MSATNIQPVQWSAHFPITQQIWHKAWQDPHSESLESVCAKIACIVFPIIFTVALVEGVVWIGRKVWNLGSGERRVDPPLPPLPDGRQAQPVTTLALHPGSSQYDITSIYDPRNERPPACTFHALNATSTIASLFYTWVNGILEKDAQGISLWQRQVIDAGLVDYINYRPYDPAFQQGADLENIRNRWPYLLEKLRLHFEVTNQEMQPVAVRTQAIAEWLFADMQQKNVAWIKSGNEESFAVVSHNGRAIIFDSHKNEITLVHGKERTQAFLTAKLAPYSQMQDGVDLNAFSYAVGTYLE